MKWNIVHDCDNDNGEPTQWACKLTKDGQFVWIDKIGECAYGITNKASGYDYLYIAGSLQGLSPCMYNLTSPFFISDILKSKSVPSDNSSRYFSNLSSFIKSTILSV